MILFYTSRNVTGAFAKGLIVNMQIMSTVDTMIDFLTPTKTDSGQSFIEETTGLRIRQSCNLFGDYYENKAIDMGSWKEVYDDLDVSALKDYDSLHIFGGLHFPQSELTRFSKRSKKFPDDRGQIKFRQTAMHIVNIMAMHKAHVIYDIPLHEFSYDTDELSTNLFKVDQNPSKYHQYHIYDMPEYNMKRLDSLQYHLLSRHTFMDFDEKHYDFTLGYTVYAYGNREEYAKQIDDVVKNFDISNIYIKNNVTKYDNSISRDLYLDKIAQSRYTYIIPSYDNKCFSLYRFIEAIYYDCLPLIHEDCYLDDVAKCFDVDLKDLVRTTPFSEEERLSKLEYLKHKILRVERLFDDNKS